ncbi:MAG: glycosyltransferase [bacterium]|nr:glycosyltransferase [bacterium]
MDSAAPELRLVEGLAELQALRVALAHYWLVTWRGGEKVLASMLKLFPHSDLYTLFYSPGRIGPYVEGHRVYSSALDLSFARRHYQKMFPFYPAAVKSLALQGDYDLLISSESGPIKGIANPKGLPHLCYIHSPMRYCWVDRQSYLDRVPQRLRNFADVQFERLKRYDLSTIDAPDRYVANSHNVAGRVERFYHRPAGVCHPPIELDLFKGPLSPGGGDFYLSFGALTPYKRVDLLVEVFNQNGKPLKIIGEGSELKALKAIAGPNITFTGALEHQELNRQLKGARALLFPGDEDFGMIPLEVMARGIPVVAYRAGGALETVLESPEGAAHSSGLFFDQQTPDSLAEALERFEAVEQDFDPAKIREHARQFGEDRFLACLAQEVRSLLKL